MRSVSIIGAGQAGLQLGIGLLKAGCNVSLYSHQTAEEVLNGNILSSPSMFHSALQCERDLGLNYWDSDCPKNTTVTYVLSESKKSKVALHWLGKTSHPYQTVDQRLKFSRWIKEFIQLGGHFILQNVGVEALNLISQREDLTIVATGKGEISQLFSKEVTHSVFDKPQRVLCCLYVKGVRPVADSQGVRANIIPGVGEYFITPGLTSIGPCEMMLFEGLPGGTFDCWQGITDSTQRLEKALELLKKFAPWEAEHYHDAVLTDNKATLQGSYIPIVRKPTINLNSKKPILGLGDTVVLNDPIGGQGANSASKAAAFYLKEINEHQDPLFTEEWMCTLFEAHWEQFAQLATRWTNLLLSPSQAFIDLLRAASKQPALANQLADAFDDPEKLLSVLTE